jgi:hypothetical protein
MEEEISKALYSVENCPYRVSGKEKFGFAGGFICESPNLEKENERHFLHESCSFVGADYRLCSNC